jgi:hypothetical protein
MFFLREELTSIHALTAGCSATAFTYGSIGPAAG